jgi:phage baseplate assembly protein W
MALIIKQNFTKAGNSFSEKQRSTIYADVSTSIEPTEIISPYGMGSSKQNEIPLNTNIGAIRNSVINLLTIQKGERVYNKNYGLSLERYIGVPLTEDYAEELGNDIKDQLRVYEPRVSIQTIGVIPDVDQNLFRVVIFLNVPTLKETFVIDGDLSRATGSLTFVKEVRMS